MFGLSLNTGESKFEQKFNSYLLAKSFYSNSVRDDVSKIIEKVRKNGDQAVINATNQFDGRNVFNFEDLKVPKETIILSANRVDKEILDAMLYSFERIVDFHQDQIKKIDLTFSNNSITRRVRALDSVAMYIPGGKASYPSTVLMATGPARAAGVNKLILTSPWPGGSINDLTLAAAYIAGVEEVYSIGGVQAIAAFGIGTESIPKVQKIIGPGNQFVAEAKRQLYGEVGIDSIAGPTEIVVIADLESDPTTIAWDLMAQAEHDELASSILISSSQEIINEVNSLMKIEVPLLSRSNIIKTSLNSRGASILVENIEQAVNLVNRIAPEHVHVVTKGASKDADNIINAGLILVGQDSANAFSDYVLGPSHILPTAGSAAYNSPLSVEDFIVHSSFVKLSSDSKIDDYDKFIANTSILARAEGLTAHAISAEIRKKKD